MKRLPLLLVLSGTAIYQPACDPVSQKLYAMSQLSRECLNLLDKEVTVAGTLETMTFDNAVIAGTTRYEIVGHRYALIRHPEFRCDLSKAGTWSQWENGVLGLKLPDSWFEEGGQVPPNGTYLEASGVFRIDTWNNHIVPMAGDIGHMAAIPSLSESGQITPERPQLGETCQSDMECDDNLICNRSTNLCAHSPGFQMRGSTWHDMNGACETDDECPLGQVCYLEYTIGDESGEYTVFNLIDQDLGKHICVPQEGKSLESLCPQIGTPADLAGERYATGKEVCIKGKALVVALSPADAETHVQLEVDKPEAYPDITGDYATWGATTEIPPQYRNPILGDHTVGIPEKGEEIIVLGTYRFDEKHGWFEVHPVKAWWPVDSESE